MIGLEDLQAEVPPSPERRVHTPSLQFSFEESDVACGMLTLQCKTHLQSGQVLSTLKSSCGCCGGEYIDQANVPEDLSSAGIQITQKEYEQAISLLMKDCKFHCHVCCYNIPLAIIIFLLLLVFCLVVIPLLDSLVLQGMALGFELMHGIILWLGLLVTYLLVTWVFKRHMGRRVNGRLAKANAIFMQYDVLAGVEELSVVNCNKYFLHFIYFETGPCMSYLQELLTTLEEHSHSYLNQTFEGEDTAVECENGQVINDSIEVDFSQHRAIDRIRVLPGKYNKPVQTQAETLLLQHSGEYVRQLITNKIPTPRKNRHAQQIQCLCQFVEKSVYKVDV